MRFLYAALFRLLAVVGRPFGGIRPRRITHSLARRAYGSHVPKPREYRWHRDRKGNEFLLHPYYHLDYSIMAFGAYELSLVHVIEKQVAPGAVCLDVGANIGAIALTLARQVSPGGIVHAFEPVPHLFQRLWLHTWRNDLLGVVQLHNVALSNRSGTMTMAIAPLEDTNQGMGSIVSKGSGHLTSHVEIQMLTLDEFAERHRLERLDFVKLDIQGAEPLFLEGAVKTLRRFHPLVVMEIAPEDLIDLGLTSRDLLKQMEELGYQVYEFGEDGEIRDRVRLEDVPKDYASSGVLCRAVP